MIVRSILHSFKSKVITRPNSLSASADTFSFHSAITATMSATASAGNAFRFSLFPSLVTIISTNSASTAIISVHRPRFFAKPAKKGKADSGPKKGGDTSQLPSGWDALNIYKDGKPPEKLDDKDYPEWLSSLLDPLPTLADLEVEYNYYYDTGGEAMVLDKMGEEKIKRLFRMKRNEKIKEYNARLRK